MLRGDISNQYGYCIAFRCEDFLVKYKDNTVADKILNLFKGKYNRADIDEKVLNVMEYLYKHTEYMVALIVETSKYKNNGFKELVDSLPFNEIILIDKPSQLSQRLLIGDISLYVDDDIYRRSIINSRYAIPLSELNQHIKLKGVRFNGS